MPALTKLIRRIASLFAEKPAAETNDFEVEHFLLYHGLIGSRPENLREFKDVRADIRQAVRVRSSAQLAISLKLPPLFWEDRLKTIFSEMDDRDVCISLLAPEIRDDAMFFDDVPILHSDWQVRSNAAILLAHLNATSEFDKLKRSLDDTTSSARRAFCHQAYALGRLKHPEVASALAAYLDDEDPWIRVDAAGALAASTADHPSPALLQALLVKHPLSDYAAVAISRSIRPIDLISSSDKLAQQAGYEMIGALLEAANQTFTNDIVIETGIHECLPVLTERLNSSSGTSFKLVRTALCLAEWLQSHRSYTLLSPPSQKEIDSTLCTVRSDQFAETLMERLNELLQADLRNDIAKTSELRSALQIVRHLKIRQAASPLQQALSVDHLLLDYMVEALGALGRNEPAAKLIEIASALVDMEERTDLVKKAHPVHEDNPKKARTYWLILRELGRMAENTRAENARAEGVVVENENRPLTSTLKFLLQAAKDHAPDKRAQALESLVTVTAAIAGDNGQNTAEIKLLSVNVNQEIAEALQDPSPEVRKTALKGMRTLDLARELKKIVAMTAAKEVSLSKEAFETLSELAKKGHKDAVVETVRQALKTETDMHKRQRLKQFIETTEG